MNTRRDTLRLLPLMILGSARAAKGQLPNRVPDLEKPRCEIGPLVMTGTVGEAVTCAWAPDVSVHDRRIGGKVPEEGDTTPDGLQLTNGYIQRRYSRDAQEDKMFVAQFEEGIRLLLGNTPFWFMTAGVGCGTNFIPLHGAIYLNGNESERLDAKLVRAGYAVVAGNEVSMTKIDSPNHRDDLLRVEGMAQVEKLGVWKVPSKGVFLRARKQSR